MHPGSRLSAEQAAEIGRRYYGIDGVAERLAGEYDDAFRLAGADGVTRLLKAGAGAGVSFQTAVLTHLARVAPELPVQRVVPALDGRTEFTLDGRLVRMTTYLDGVPLASVPSCAELRRDIGATLARLSRALRGFSHPGAARTHLWDLQNFGQLRAHLDDLGDIPQRAALRECLERFDTVLLPRLARVRQQVIHADFHGDNLLSDGRRVTGILDFGDALTGPVAMDVGIAACYQLGDCADRLAGDPLGPAIDVVAGYHAVDPLEPDDVALAGEFILLRLAARIIVSQWNAAREPANQEYLLRRTPQAVRQFSALRATGTDSITTRLRHALGEQPP